MTRQWLGAVLAVVIVVSLSACGASPTEPSGASASGSWSGTLGSSNFQTLAMTMQLAQSGSSITGTWAAGIPDWSGTVSGTNSNGQFAGTMTLSAPNAAGIGPRCTGNASVTGTVAAAQLRWNSSGFSGSCTGMPQSVSLSLNK